MTVTVYTKPNCIQCNMTHRFLEKHEIPFETVDITTDRDAYNHVVSDLGYMAAPVVKVSDEEHWSGFQPERLKALAELVSA